MFLRHFHYCFCALLLFSPLFTVPVWGQEDILKTAKSLDDALISGITIFCTRESYFPGRGIIPQSTSHHKVRFTRSQDKIAAIYEHDDSIIPSSENHDKTAMISGRIVICSDKKKSTKKDYAIYWDDTEKAWIQKESNVNLHIVDSDSSTINSWTDPFFWSIGKGIVGQVVDVAESKIETDNEGLKHFFLRGKDDKNREWNIDLLPDKSCIIRKAIHLLGENLEFTITTNGDQLFGGFFFPKHALVELLLGTKINKTNYHITNVILEFDEQIYNEAKNDIDKEMPQSSLVKDESSGQEKVYISGYNDYTNSTHDPIGHKPNFLFIGGVNLIGISLILYLYFRDRRKKNNRKH
jgi:hypothetical protein